MGPPDGKKTGRDKSGRFTTGNPGGGRPALPEAFRKRGPEMVNAIAKIADDEEHPERFKALVWCAERIYGKAAQAVEVGGEDLPPALMALLALARRKESGE